MALEVQEMISLADLLHYVVLAALAIFEEGYPKLVKHKEEKVLVWTGHH